jgi:hypothetical protein
MTTNQKGGDETFTEQETARRRDAIIKRMLAMPPKPHAKMKVGKTKKKAGRPKKAD